MFVCCLVVPQASWASGTRTGCVVERVISCPHRKNLCCPNLYFRFQLVLSALLWFCLSLSFSFHLFLPFLSTFLSSFYEVLPFFPNSLSLSLFPPLSPSLSSETVVYSLHLFVPFRWRSVTLPWFPAVAVGITAVTLFDVKRFH